MRSRRGAGPLRGISGVLLGAVAAAGLLAVGDATGVERAAHDLVAHTGEVLHTTATHEHDGVLLEVVPDAGDVGRDLDARGEAHTSDLAQRRVGLLRRVGEHARAHAPALGRALEGGGLRLLGLGLPSFADELLDRGHETPTRVEQTSRFSVSRRRAWSESDQIS